MPKQNVNETKTGMFIIMVYQSAFTFIHYIQFFKIDDT